MTPPIDRLRFVMCFREIAERLERRDSRNLSEPGRLLMSALSHGFFQSLPGAAEWANELEPGGGATTFFLQLFNSWPNGLLSRLYPEMFNYTDYRSQAERVRESNYIKSIYFRRSARAQDIELSVRACRLLADILEREHTAENGPEQLAATNGAGDDPRHASEDEHPPLDSEAVAILKYLDERFPVLCGLEDIAAATHIGRATVGTKVNTLIDDGYANRPRARKGATLTDKGRNAAALLMRN